MNAVAARPAQFDQSSRHRRSLLAKVHVAIKQLDMIDDDYRQLLFETTGQMSASKCNEAQLARMIDVLKSKGFQPVQAGGKGVAQHPMGRKARALWISLYQLGAVHNPSEQALDAFAKRQLGCDKLIWANQSQAFRLIEALKDWGRREGWRMENYGISKPMTPIELQSSLCHAILAKLKATGAIPQDWGLHDAALRLCGIENRKEGPWTAEDYQRLAGGLGSELRRFGSRGAK